MNSGTNGHSNGNSTGTDVLTQVSEHAIIKHRVQELLSLAEAQLYKRMRMLSNVAVLVELNAEGQPIAWIVLGKREKPSRTE